MAKFERVAHTSLVLPPSLLCTITVMIVICVTGCTHYKTILYYGETVSKPKMDSLIKIGVQYKVKLRDGGEVNLKVSRIDQENLYGEAQITNTKMPGGFKGEQTDDKIFIVSPPIPSKNIKSVEVETIDRKKTQILVAIIAGTLTGLIGYASGN